MKNIFKISLLSVMFVFFTNCEVTELDLLEDPNNINIESADPNFILNNVELTFSEIMNGLSGPSMAITRMTNMFGTYNQAVDENTFAFEWPAAYGMFVDVDLLEQINENDPVGIPYHVGVARILEAYTYMTLVDYLGDVPFSQATNGSEFPTPMTDDGAVIYAAQIDLIDSAIALLNQETNVQPLFELYFDNEFSKDNWIALANTLKLRAYLNTGNAAGIASLAGENIIDTLEEDFQYNYGTFAVAPESRHPFYVNNYLAAAGTYMSNQYYDFLNAGNGDAPFEETGIADPRLRYYVYRQRVGEPSGSNLPCTDNPAYDYCYVGNGYWGRDHADDEGIPNDGARRTTYGVYPAGGAFDREEFVRARDVTNTLDGAGIFPIYTSSFTHFALAEAALTINTGGDAAGLLEQGIRLSMTKVTTFGDAETSLDGTDFAATSSDIEAYVTRVTTEYSAAGSADKLAIVAREWFLASFGNGVEPYNLYKRTALPNLQAPIFPAATFPRSFRFPTDEITANPNITQNSNTDRVFWDTNPADLD
jgi:hypothetical protein